MASTTSRSSARARDKDKAVRGTGVRHDIAGSVTRSNARPRRSNAFKSDPQPLIINFNGDVQITKGTMFGGPPDEDLESSPRSRPTLPATPSAYGKIASRKQNPGRIVDVDSEESEEYSEESESGGGYSYEDEPSQRSSVRRATPTSKQRVQALQDSGYEGSTRESRQGKKGVYRASLSRSRGSSDEFLAEEGPSHTKRRLKRPSGKPDIEGGSDSEDNETHLARREADEGENGDSSDDDFERRLMKVATIDNSEVDVRVILDTGTKPDWVSKHFLTEKLGLKYTRLSEEGSKQEFSDFNGNKFNGIGQTELMIHSNDFIGFPARRISFLVAKRGTFQILLGSRTIKQEKLLCKPLDPQREGAFPAVQTDPKKAERAIIVQNKEKQKKEGAERDKMREEKRRKAKTSDRKESKSSSSSAARLAQESKPQRRREASPSASPSPLIYAKYPGKRIPQSSLKNTKAPVHEWSSSSSLSGGGAAIYD